MQKYKIKSYSGRFGRMSKLQKTLLNYHLKNIELKFDKTSVISNTTDIVLDLGCGNGESSLKLSRICKDSTIYSIEIYSPSVANLTKSIIEHGISNIIVIKHDCEEVLTHMLPEESVSNIYILFPDPWHKRKHNKRRLIKPDLIKTIVKILKRFNILTLITDNYNYAIHSYRLLLQEAGLISNLIISKEDGLSKYWKTAINNSRPVYKIISIKI